MVGVAGLFGSGSGVWYRFTPFLVGCAFFFLFSAGAIPYSHDWEYAVKLADLGAFEFLREHYQTTNGRLWVHFLIGLLGDHYPLGMFISGAVLFAFPWLAVWAANPARDAPGLRDVWLFLLWLGLLLNFPSPYYVIGFFWITGTLNYIWPSALLLGVFFLVWREPPVRHTAGVVLTLALIALTASSHEMIALYTLMAVGGRVAFLLLKRRKIPVWLIIGVIIAIAAFLSILSAPGNAVRLGEDSAGQRVLASLHNNYSQLAARYFYDAIFQVIILALLLAMASYIGLRSNLDQRVRYAGVLLLGGLVLGYLMLTQWTPGAVLQWVWLGLYAVVLLGFAVLMLVRENRPDLFALMLLLCVMQGVPLLLPGLGPRVLLPQLLIIGAYALMLFKLSLAGLKRGGLALAAGALLLLGFGVPNSWAIYQGYQKNQAAGAAMEAKIRAFASAGAEARDEPLVLRRLPSPAHRWEMPYKNPGFTEYFYRFFGLDQEALVAWEGEATDDRQRSAVRRAGALAAALRNGEDSPLFEPKQQHDWECTAATWQNFLIFKADLWGCSNLEPFRIQLYDQDGPPVGDYAGRLADDRYMVVINGLSEPYSTHFIYTFGLNANRNGLDYEYRINWLGRYVSVR